MLKTTGWKKFGFNHWENHDNTKTYTDVFVSIDATHPEKGISSIPGVLIRRNIDDDNGFRTKIIVHKNDFKSRTQAIQFAKRWMRLHPNG